MLATGATAPSSHARLLHDLASGPAKKGYAIAYDLLRNRAEAEEAVQEALARACENIDDLRDTSAATPWFLRIVTTQCLKTLRRRRLRQAIFGRKDSTEDAVSQLVAAADAMDAVGAHQPAPRATAEGQEPHALAARLHALSAVPAADEALNHKQQRQQLLRVLEQLPAKQKAAIVLRYGHDVAVADIAASLNISQATAKTHLVRGLEKLRNLLTVTP